MKTYFYDAVVIGSGCAGYNCADWLYDLGMTNIALMTEGKLAGTSRHRRELKACSKKDFCIVAKCQGVISARDTHIG